MADTKISALPSATTPLAGTEVLPIVQSGATVKVPNNDLRPKQIQSNATSGVLQVTGPTAGTTRVMTTPDANFTAARTDAAQTFTGNQTFGTATGSSVRTAISTGSTVSQAGSFGRIAANGNTKTLTLTFDSALGTIGIAGVFIDASFFGGYAYWNARGISRIVTTLEIPDDKNSVTASADTTLISNGGIGTVVTRTGATCSTTTITAVYTFNAGNAGTSPVNYFVTVSFACESAASTRNFTLSWT